MGICWPSCVMWGQGFGLEIPASNSAIDLRATPILLDMWGACVVLTTTSQATHIPMQFGAMTIYSKALSLPTLALSILKL
jgi:hypothetical protein